MIPVLRRLARLPRQLAGRSLRRWRAWRLRRQQPFAPVRPVAPPPPSRDFPSARPDAFDADRAWAILLAHNERPRFPGSAGHGEMRRFLLEQLGACADELAVQEWDQRIARGAGAGQVFRLANVFGLFHGTGDRGAPVTLRVDRMLSAHWDTRPVADHDPDPARRREPVPGANDGASGVAVLLELARRLRVAPPPGTVAIVFWDGEDLGEHYYGSRLFGRWLHRPEMARWRARTLLLVGAGGGREVLALARRGYVVEAYECNAALATGAAALLASEGCPAPVLPLPRDEAPLEGEPRDGIVVGWSTYMLIPGRERRVGFLRGLRGRVGEGAPLLLSFWTRRENAPRDRVVRAAAAPLRWIARREPVEPGDDLAPNFVHRFTEAEVAAEMAAAGFHLHRFEPAGREPYASGWAVGRAAAPAPADG